MRNHRSLVYNQLNDLRAVYHLVNTPLFDKAYCGQAEVDKILAECQSTEQTARTRGIENLRKWIRQQSGLRTIQEIRDRAAQIGVKNYSRLAKADLLMELERHEQQKKKQKAGGSGNVAGGNGGASSQDSAVHR